MKTELGLCGEVMAFFQLWIPPEHRPMRQMVQDSVIAMGYPLGRVTIFRIKVGR
jgi:hypothetical protein